jgi:hypothetical protein
MLLLLPAFLVYYVSAGTRHRLAWHAPLLGGLAAAVAANGFWLYDWVSFWWIRVPPGLDTPLLEQPGLRALWEVPLWGGGADKALACALLVVAGVGLAVLNQTGQRPAARLLGLCGPGLAALVLAGAVWEPLGRLGLCQLLLPALWFACLPAAVALARGLALARRWGGAASPAVLCAAAPALLWLTAPAPAVEWAEQFTHPRPLSTAPGEEERALVELLCQRTDGSARVLWEDLPRDRKASRWPALLPLLTERSFIGGLDAEAAIEHATCGLIAGQLAGRPLAEWTDAELADYCRRYNVGWVVCFSPESRRRFASWPAAGQGHSGPADGAPCLFTLKREHNFALEGSARWRSAGPEGVLLADVEPRLAPGAEEGEVVLSLHYQAGMRARPSRIRLEPALDPRGAIPFVRLRLKEPVGRVFITWEGR